MLRHLRRETEAPVLIDPHASPGDLDPAAFAAACREAGLDAVVVADRLSTHRLDSYLDALEDAGLAAFAGVELPLERGSVVVIPSEDGPAFRGMKWGTTTWTPEMVAERLRDFDGALIASHPYLREGPGAMGDRVYFLKGLTGVQTRAGRGELSWDAMADRAADRKKLVRLGSSGGSAAHIGAAATVLPGEVEDQAGLVAALRDGSTLVVEFDDPQAPRDRRPPRREPREARDDRRGGRGRDRDERGGRGRDRGGRGRERRGGRGRRDDA